MLAIRNNIDVDYRIIYNHWDQFQLSFWNAYIGSATHASPPKVEMLIELMLGTCCYIYVMENEADFRDSITNELFYYNLTQCNEHEMNMVLPRIPNMFLDLFIRDLGLFMDTHLYQYHDVSDHYYTGMIKNAPQKEVW